MKQILLLTCLLLAIPLQAQLPEPYASVKLLPLDLQGWFSESNKTSLTQLITTNKPNVVVELGSWLGASATYLATLLPPNGILYCVDTWLGSVEHSKDPVYAKDLPTLYEQFLSNCIHMGVTDKIIPVRMRTDEAAKQLPIKADLVYVDASHEEEDVFQDIMLWYPKLNTGGIMCGDDWTWESVRLGVNRAAKLLNYNIGFVGSFWIFVPKNTPSEFPVIEPWEVKKDKQEVAPVVIQKPVPQRVIGRKVVTPANMNERVMRAPKVREHVTPLMKTIIHKDLNGTRWLLRMGARINQKTKSGMTALHYAAKYNNVEAVRFLLLNKANKTVKNKQGQRASDLTTNKRIQQLLLQDIKKGYV